MSLIELLAFRPPQKATFDKPKKKKKKMWALPQNAVLHTATWFAWSTTTDFGVGLFLLKICAKGPTLSIAVGINMQNTMFTIAL